MARRGGRVGCRHYRRNKILLWLIEKISWPNFIARIFNVILIVITNRKYTHFSHIYGISLLMYFCIRLHFPTEHFIKVIFTNLIISRSLLVEVVTVDVNVNVDLVTRPR